MRVPRNISHYKELGVSIAEGDGNTQFLFLKACLWQAFKKDVYNENS
jgi:hypothetical protein